MLNLTTIHEFKSEVKKELLENILPFWMEKTVEIFLGWIGVA